jgi:hypothetical protein
MKFRALLVLAALTLFTPALRSQTVPVIPATPAAPPAAVAPAAPAQPTTTIWNYLGINKECCQNLHDKCCKSPLGQMLNNMTKPLTFATGGLVGPLCPDTPSADQLKKILDPNSTASDAEKTAAAIKADEAGAAQRRAAIRYLGTVDCHYYPEAADALISGLRGDHNECVRLEAALALTRGCCCTRKTIAALLLVVSGSDSDGHPAETSERVKNMAQLALELCNCRSANMPESILPPERPPGEVPPETPKSGIPDVELTRFYTKELPKTNTAALVDAASRYLAETVSTSPATRTLPSGQRNLTGAVNAAWSEEVSKAQENRAFEDAILTTPRLRPPQAQTSPVVASVTPPTAAPQGVPARVEAPSGPVQLTAPGAVLRP